MPGTLRSRAIRAQTLVRFEVKQISFAAKYAKGAKMMIAVLMTQKNKFALFALFAAKRFLRNDGGHAYRQGGRLQKCTSIDGHAHKESCPG